MQVLRSLLHAAPKLHRVNTTLVTSPSKATMLTERLAAICGLRIAHFFDLREIGLLNQTFPGKAQPRPGRGADVIGVAPG